MRSRSLPNRRNPRVLHVLNWSGDEYGGPVTGLSRYMDVLTANHQVLARRDGLETHSFDAIRQRSFNLRTVDKMGPSNLLLVRRNAVILEWVSWAEIVHLHGVHGQLLGQVGRAAAELGRAVVLRPCGAMSPLERSKKPWRKYAYERFVMGGELLRSATVIHATSVQELSDVRELGPSQPIILARPAPAADLLGRTPRPECGRQGHTHVVAYTGRLHRRKNLPLVALAIRRLIDDGHDIQLRIAGTGDRRIVENVRNILGRRAAFLGHVSGSEKTAHLATACCGILVSNHENWGVAVQESWEVGRPMIVSPGVALSTEIAQDARLGAVVAPDVESVVEGLAKVLDGLAHDPPRGVHEACQDWIRRLREESRTELRHLYDRALRDHRGAL